MEVLTGNVKLAIQTHSEIFLSVMRPLYSHTGKLNYPFAIYKISLPNYSADPSSVRLFFRNTFEVGLHANVGGCKYSDSVFRQGLINEASVMGTFLTMNMRVVRNQ